MLKNASWKITVESLSALFSLQMIFGHKGIKSVLSKRRATIWSMLAAIVLLSAFACQGTFKNITQSREDLRPLQEVATTQSYAALIRTIKAEPAPPEGFAFVVLGDSRGNMEMAKKVYRQAALEKPAFIMHTGDLTSHGTVADYLHYHLPLVDQIAPLPVIPVPGNHEKGPEEDFSGFKAIYGADRFSFVFGGCRFVGVNNGDEDRLSTADLKYLETELSAPVPGMKFVFQHVPPTFVEKSAAKARAKVGYHGFTANADALRNLMKSKKVQAVFFGHDHGFATRTFDGVHYTITGGAGAHLYKRMNWLVPEYHYVVVFVTPQGVRQELVRLHEDQWVRSRIE